MSHDGIIIAAGRNHAYDPPTGTDTLENTPLAHAELNVLARIQTDRELTTDVLWSTQQPCSMCEAAIRFCGVGDVVHLAADPSFAGTAVALAPEVIDPTEDRVEATPLALLANAMFLQPFIARGLETTLEHNRSEEPETVQLAEILAIAGPPSDVVALLELVAESLPKLTAARTLRRTGY